MNADLGLQSPRFPVPHFFGTRTLPPSVQGRFALGHVTEGPGEAPCLATLKQIHSTKSIILKSPVRPGPLPDQEGDALVTNHPGTLVSVRTADCVPVLLVDEQAGVVAAIHAGWRGAVAGIVPETIAICVTQFQSHPASLKAAVGPSIGPCCYEVDAPVIDPLRARYPDWPGVLEQTSVGKGRLDLKRLIRHQLLEAGLAPACIDTVELCTHCRADLFYSYRREGQVIGTMVSGAMLPG